MPCLPGEVVLGFYWYVLYHDFAKLCPQKSDKSYRLYNPFHIHVLCYALGPGDAFMLLMKTSSNGNIFRATGPLCGEFTGPVTWSFGVFFDLRLNKRLSKQPWGLWFETPPWSLWRQCDVLVQIMACRLNARCLYQCWRFVDLTFRKKTIMFEVKCTNFHSIKWILKCRLQMAGHPVCWPQWDNP